MSEKNAPSSERSYKAFISYRHKPLDMETAKKLHKRIERFTVPAELRKNGEKKPGLVFRDQDELPIANNLSENIRTALDHSEFLIVICSPDTPASVWVQREITYFLSHHSRDKVLAMLVAGEPDQSFPPQLTEIRDDSGDILERIEPLAANIVADSAGKRNRLFKTESLRILAALIGCPYDALYQREQRWKIRRILIASLITVLIAAGFIGMLLNRNAKIKEQLNNTLINESKTLAALSEVALRDGDYRAALNYALDALPGRNPDRPFVAAAEDSLSSALYLYQQGSSAMGYLQSFTQETDIREIALSPDGSLLASSDSYGTVSVYDTHYGKLLWKAKLHSGNQITGFYFSKENDLLVHAAYENACYNAEGTELWSSDNFWMVTYSAEAGLFMDTENVNGQTDYVLRNMKDGKPSGLSWVREKDMVMEAVISEDGKYAAMLEYSYDAQSGTLYVCDLTTGEKTIVADELFCTTFLTDYELRFSDDAELIAVCSGDADTLKETSYGGPFALLFDGKDQWRQRFAVTLDFGTAIRRVNGTIDTSDYPDFVACGKNGIAVAAKTRMVMIDKETGEISWQKDLPGYVVNAIMYDNDTMGLVLNNGAVTLCTDDGIIGYDLILASFECKFDIYAAASAGDRFYTSRFAVISNTDRYRAALVGYREDANLETASYADQIPESTRLYYSPSFQKAAGICAVTQSGTRQYQLMTFDPAGKGSVSKMTYNGSSFSYTEQDHIFVTEDGKILAGGIVFEPEKGTYKGMTFTGEAPKKLHDASVKDPNGSVITCTAEMNPNDQKYYLLCYENGVLTDQVLMTLQPLKSFSFYSYHCLSAGANGYAVVSVSEEYNGPYSFAVYSWKDKTWLEAPYLDTSEENAVCLANKNPWAAVLKQDGTLALYDISSGERRILMGDGLSSSNTSKMMFDPEDRRLFVFTKSGDLSIYDTKDGTLLNHTSYARQNLRFYKEARYDVQIIPDSSRILVIHDNTLYREPVALVYDMETMEPADSFYGVSAYLPQTGKVLTASYQSQISYAPLYTLEDMRHMAEIILGNENP